MASCRRLEESQAKLDEALEESSGIPVRPIDPEDSLAVSIDTAREGAREELDLLNTSRSARALRRAASQSGR
jgi:hypothetical protein